MINFVTFLSVFVLIDCMSAVYTLIIAANKD